MLLFLQQLHLQPATPSSRLTQMSQEIPYRPTPCQSNTQSHSTPSARLQTSFATMATTGKSSIRASTLLLPLTRLLEKSRKRNSAFLILAVSTFFPPPPTAAEKELTAAKVMECNNPSHQSLDRRLFGISHLLQAFLLPSESCSPHESLCPKHHRLHRWRRRHTKRQH